MNNLVYRNKQEFDKKLENMKQDWVSKLHILADFDRTLTKAYVNWKKTWSLVSVLRTEEAQLGWECARKDTELFDIYHPIEIDPNIEMEEKKQKMIEWWTSSFNLFIEYWLSIEALKQVAKTKKAELRDLYYDFAEYLDKNDIPLVIISASWIGKLSIQYFLEERWAMTEDIHIISNDFDWDENGYAKSFKRPIIHTFNKDETIVSAFPEIHDKVKNRTNVILLWDSLWDHHMVDGYDYENLICIGFLNENEEKNIDEYKARYDLVITWDWNFQEINNILNSIK